VTVRRIWILPAVILFFAFVFLFKKDDDKLRLKAQTGGSCPQQYMTNANGDPILDSCDSCCDDACSDALFYGPCLYACMQGNFWWGTTSQCCACCGNPGSCSSGGVTGGSGGSGGDGGSSAVSSAGQSSSADPECAQDSDCGDLTPLRTICGPDGTGSCSYKECPPPVACVNGQCRNTACIIGQRPDIPCACPASSSSSSVASSTSSSHPSCTTDAQCHVETACSRCEVVMNTATCTNTCDQYFCKDGECTAGYESVSCAGNPLCTASSHPSSRPPSSASSSVKACSTDTDCGGGLVCTTGCRPTGNGCTQACKNTPAVCQNNVCVYGQGDGLLKEYQCDPSACIGSSSSSRSGDSSRSSVSSQSQGSQSSNGSNGSNSSNTSNTSNTSQNSSASNSTSAASSAVSISSNRSQGSQSSNGSNGSNGSNSSKTSQNSSGSNGSNGSGGSQGSSRSSRSSSSSSSIILVGGQCNGTECRNGGDVFCAGQNKTCLLTSALPCITCIGGTSSASVGSSLSRSSASSVQIVLTFDSSASSLPVIFLDTSSDSSRAFSSQRSGSLPTDVVVFLGETCTADAQCITNLCVNHLCDVCARDADCASGLCRNGICLNAGLPLGAACNEDRQCVSGHCINGLCAPADHTAPTQTLPATVIELPFMTDVQKPFSENQEPYADGWIDWDDGTDGSAITKGDIPSTPSTGPAALGVMLAGAAAGWLYRRRK
jgi:hypothetical protein